MGEQHRGNNLNTPTITSYEILATHKEKIQDLIEMVMAAACHIEGQPNLWEALQKQPSRDYLQTHFQTSPGINYIGVIKSFLAERNTNNRIVAINLLSEILLTNTILVGQNGIESILPNSQNGGGPRHYTTCNQDIRRNLFQIKNHLRNPKHWISREECFDPIFWVLINAEKDLEKERDRIDSQVLAVKSAEKLRNLSGVVGVSIATLSYFVKFKYAELSYFGGLIATGYSILQHCDYLAILRQLTKAKA